MNPRIANVISILFHPIWFPLFISWVIIRNNPVLFSGSDPRLMLIIIFVLTLLLPIVSLFVMRGLDMISSIELEDRQERIIPLIAFTTFFLWAYFGSLKPGMPQITSAPPILANFILGGGISLGLIIFLNGFLKISLHTAGAGAAFGGLWNAMPLSDGPLLWWFLTFVLIGGLAGTARLALEKHSIQEVMLGYFIGFLSQFAAYQVLSGTLLP